VEGGGFLQAKEVGATLVVKNNRFLFVNAVVGTPAGLWNNPGGHVEKNESLEDAAVRETLEETGFVVSLGRLAGTFRFVENGRLIVKYVFEAEIVSGELRIPPEEIKEAKWFSLSEMENESLFTFGAVQSAKDFILGKFNQKHDCDRVP